MVAQTAQKKVDQKERMTVELTVSLRVEKTADMSETNLAALKADHWD